MVHNGIEYGIMAAYAEELGILRSANIGKQEGGIDAETTPLPVPEHYLYDFNLPDITQVWRRGSVIASWLLDLTATALLRDPALSTFEGRVSDSVRADRQSKPSMRRYRRQCSPPPYMRASVREAMRSSPIKSFLQCVMNLADTKNDNDQPCI